MCSFKLWWLINMNFSIASKEIDSSFDEENSDVLVYRPRISRSAVAYGIRKSSTRKPTTTRRPTTTRKPTTAHKLSTTRKPTTTTHKPTSTRKPTTTPKSTTTRKPTTTIFWPPFTTTPYRPPSNISQKNISITNPSRWPTKPTTTHKPATTHKSTTTHKPATTHNHTITLKPTTTIFWPPFTTTFYRPPSNISQKNISITNPSRWPTKPSTTHKPASTHNHTTTLKPTTTHKPTTTIFWPPFTTTFYRPPSNISQKNTSVTDPSRWPTKPTTTHKSATTHNHTTTLYTLKPTITHKSTTTYKPTITHKPTTTHKPTPTIFWPSFTTTPYRPPSNISQKNISTTNSSKWSTKPTTTHKPTTTILWTPFPKTTTRPPSLQKNITKTKPTARWPNTKSTKRPPSKLPTIIPITIRLPPKPNKDGNFPKEWKTTKQYNIHVAGIYSLPTPNQNYRGYYISHTYHEYTQSETGNDVLGFYLGYKLGKLTTPTYSYYTFYDGYRPLYDHYTVHHYYHGKEAVAARQEIVSNKILGCEGDAAEVCPTNTTSLCTKDGKLMCVAPVPSTILCNDNPEDRCVKSEIACQNNKSPECQNKERRVSVRIPCIAAIKIEGEVKVKDNTILADHISVKTTSNATLNTSSVYVNSSNNPTEPKKHNINITTYYTNTNSNGNVMLYFNSTNNITQNGNWSTKYPITTTPFIIVDNGISNVTTTTMKPTPRQHETMKKVQTFCVVVVAVPAPRPVTKGEKLLDSASDFFNNFIGNVFGL